MYVYLPHKGCISSVGGFPQFKRKTMFRSLSSLQKKELNHQYGHLFFKPPTFFCQRGLWEFDATSCSCLDQRPEGTKEKQKWWFK